MALAAIAAVLLGGHAGAGDLVGDPLIYATLAKAMVRSGHWATLDLAGRPYFDKPPLAVWMAAVSFRLFGVSTWSARLPGVACGVGCCLLTARLGTRVAGSRVGLAAGLVLALTPHFVRYGGTLLLDPPFVLCALAGLLTTLSAWDRGGRGLWMSGAWFGAAFLAKGAQTLVVPAILVGLWLASPRAERPPFPSLVAAGVAFLAVALPWHVYELWRWGDAFIQGAVYDVTEKIGKRPPLATYLRVIVVTTLPWLPFAFAGMWRTLRAGARGVPMRLLVLWTAVAWGALFVVGKHSPRYLMLLHPALAIWTALAVAPWFPEPAWLIRTAALLAVLAWVALLGWPRPLHPKGLREAVVTVAPALGSGPAAIEGFRLGHESARASLAFYLDRTVHTTYDADVLARLPDGTPVMTLTRNAALLASDHRFVETRRSSDFVVFRVRNPNG